jgi:hypothetical protein
VDRAGGFEAEFGGQFGHGQKHPGQRIPPEITPRADRAADDEDRRRHIVRGQCRHASGQIIAVAVIECHGNHALGPVGGVQAIGKVGERYALAVALQHIEMRGEICRRNRQIPWIGAGLGNPVIHQHDAVAFHRRAQQEPGVVEVATGTRP